MTDERYIRTAAIVLERTSTTPERDFLVARRAVILAQAKAYEQIVQALKEEAALLAKQAGLTR